jgi:hypothetical protein
VDLVGLGPPLLALLLGAAVLLGVVWFLLPYAERRACPRCGNLVAGDAACSVCGAPPPEPPEAHPSALPYGFRAPSAPRGREPEVHDGVAFNAGITRRTVLLATCAMGLGIGVRLVGMAGILGLPSIPEVLDGLLTIVGGLVAFVGFVFLDRA